MALPSKNFLLFQIIRHEVDKEDEIGTGVFEGLYMS